MKRRQCVSCGAPIPLGAQKCEYCGMTYGGGENLQINLEIDGSAIARVICGLTDKRRIVGGQT